MNIKHTPGPWEATEFNEIRCVENGYIVANVPFLDRRVRGKEAAEERAGIEANKALLAAAPDLLEALQNVLEACEGYVPNTSKRVWADAYMAIAKATGEQA